MLGIREDDVCLSAAKLFFAYGLGNALTFPMSVGATTVLNSDRPTPARMFALMNKYNPTIFFGVPTLFSAMLNDETLKNERGGTRLRICTSAGEALPESVGNAWKARFGVDILDGVGSTELLHIFLSNAPGDIKYGTSGRPVPGYEVRLVNEAGSEVPDGEVGEMLVDAPSAGEGYWNQRSKSRQTFEGHWTRTGDKYMRDAEGRYTFCGRSDDMFKVSGIWVSPFEVESALITHPAVLEAAVVPEADPEGLLKPKAFVVLRADAQDRRPARGAEGARQAEDRRRGNIRAGSMWSTACRKRRPERFSGSSCAKAHSNSSSSPRAATIAGHVVCARRRTIRHMDGRRRVPAWQGRRGCEPGLFGTTWT